METLIKSIDEKACRESLTSWIHPIKTNNKGEAITKLEVEWTLDEDRLASGN